MKLVLRPEAAADMERAYAFYERQRRGLGEDLAGATWQTLSEVLESPHRFPVHRRETHRARVRRFPYIVLYRIAEGAVVVVGVFHARSDPQGWLSRQQSGG